MTDQFESLKDMTSDNLESRMEAIRNARVEAMARTLSQQRTLLLLLAMLTIAVFVWDRISIRGAGGSIDHAREALAALQAKTMSLSASSVLDRVQAKNLEIVGADGKVAIRLTTGSGGRTIVATTPDGQTLVEMGANEQGDGTITTLNAKGQQLVQIAGTASGGSIVAKSGDGHVVARIAAGDSGDGLCVAADREGHEMVKFAAATDGGSVLIQNQNSEPRIRLLSNAEGSAVAVFNNNGTPVCTLTPDEQGNGLIGAWSRNEGGQTLQGGAMTGGTPTQRTSTTDGPATKLE